MPDTCNCPPTSAECVDSFFGVTLAQPECQILPNGDRVQNPFLDIENNISHYSYMVAENCNNLSAPSNPGNLTFLSIAICENIPAESVLGVSQLLDGCPDFQEVPFDFNEPQNSTAGFRFLRIIVNQDVIEGSAAVYRIALSGIYPPETTSPPGSSIVVTTVTSGALVSITPFVYAGCPAVPRLTLTKSCNVTITDNTATLDFRIVVSNTGETDLSAVTFDDVLNYDGANITFGTITISPDTVTANTQTPGIVTFTGNLGDINMGNSVEVTYSIPISAFNSPNSYTFANMAVARAGVVEGVATCEATVEVVQITTEKCCSLSDGADATLITNLTNNTNSPPTDVFVEETIMIPQNIIIQFTSFGSCTATFSNGDPVPLNTDIINSLVRLSCSANIFANTTAQLQIMATIISINSFVVVENAVTSTLNTVTLQNTENQILLGVTPLPNSAEITVTTIVECETQF